MEAGQGRIEDGGCLFLLEFADCPPIAAVARYIRRPDDRGPEWWLFASGEDFRALFPAAVPVPLPHAVAWALTRDGGDDDDDP